MATMLGKPPSERDVDSEGNLIYDVTVPNNPNDGDSTAPSGDPTSSGVPSGDPTANGGEPIPEFPETCVSDGGNFGVSDTSVVDLIAVTVGYRYEVQTFADELNSEVLGQLESALADLLVPSLFEENELCLFDPQRNLQQPNLAPIGLLAAPADEILEGSEGVTCQTELVDSAARCYVVRGGFTLLGEGDISWAGPLALSLTEEAMTQGQLNNIINTDVVDVSFLKALNTTVSFTNGTDFVPPMDNSGSSTPATGPVGIVSIGSDEGVASWSWALVASGIIAFFVALWYIAKSMCGEKRGNATDHFDLDVDEQSVDNRSCVHAPIDGEGVAVSWVDAAGAETGDTNYNNDPLLRPSSSGHRGEVY